MHNSNLQGDPLHFINRINKQATQNPEKIIMRFKDDKQWHDITWGTVQQQMNQLGLALLSFDLVEQDYIGICANNHPRWSIADFSILQIKCVTTPLYPSNSNEQSKFVVNHAKIKILFVGDQKQYDMAVAIFNECPSLQAVICFDELVDLNPDVLSYHWSTFIKLKTGENEKIELEQRLNNKNMDDILTVIYTSGTTGTPKGVLLDYNNIAAQLKGHDERLKLSGNHSSLSFLPLSHVFERTWSYYVFHCGFVNNYLDDPKLIKDTLNEVHPTLMAAVPRFYEKIYGAIFEKVETSSLIKKAMFKSAMFIANKRKSNKNNPIALMLSPLHVFFDKLVFKKIRNLLGGQLQMMPCGGAKLAPEIGRFFHLLGINVKLGYGMTETPATVSCWEDDDFNSDSIGKVMPNVEIKIGERNEILVKGPMVMKGYLHDAQATKDTFDTSGFLKTGDAGYIDEQGNVFITDRIKELMKTSGGKYIAPQFVEGTIGKDPMIEQVIVFADDLHFVSALIVPNFEYLAAQAKQLNIEVTKQSELINNPKIIELFQQRLNELQLNLASFEQVKKFTLLNEEFSVDNGQFTPTLKLKRKVIHEYYAQTIADMYNNSRNDC
ncbi:MAG: long-chain fatty acid--CoA ligase [Saccharospirillaceae bacterium]|nr:long-chain fatty acid--CoA ligase [Pseudomonadales bacterium]NRB80052.1 long-chain fatty acid--CoA ligase [Saccharospirillaceae bacterium]